MEARLARPGRRPAPGKYVTGLEAKASVGDPTQPQTRDYVLVDPLGGTSRFGKRRRTCLCQTLLSVTPGLQQPDLPGRSNGGSNRPAGSRRAETRSPSLRMSLRPTFPFLSFSISTTPGEAYSRRCPPVSKSSPKTRKRKSVSMGPRLSTWRPSWCCAQIGEPAVSRSRGRTVQRGQRQSTTKARRTDRPNQASWRLTRRFYVPTGNSPGGMGVPHQSEVQSGDQQPELHLRR